MHVVFAGNDADGLGDALRVRGADVRMIDGIADRTALEDAGITEADTLVLTDAGQATSVVVARDVNPELRVVAYTGDSLPEFVSGQRVLAVDPALLDPETVADELLEPAD